MKASAIKACKGEWREYGTEEVSMYFVKSVINK